MRIISFNVNGLISYDKYVKEVFKCTLNDYLYKILKVDIFCIQETRGTKDKLEIHKTMKNYLAFFSHSKVRNGHAGVGFFINKKLYCKRVTNKIENIKELCDEGRVIYGDFGTFKILNVYCPFYDEKYNGSEDKYEKVKRSYNKLGEFIKNEVKTIICGDFNACYLLKDHYQFVRELKRINKESNIIDQTKRNGNNEMVNLHTNSETTQKIDTSCITEIENDTDAKNHNILQKIDIRKRNRIETYEITFNNQITRIEKPYKSSTELPYYFKNEDTLKDYFFEKYQRLWLKQFIDRNYYIDVYNHFYPNNIKYTCWNTRFDLRPSNLGTRIDYIFVSQDLLKNAKQIEIDNTVFGSDHCPVILDIELEIMHDENNILTKNKNILSFLKK